MNTQPAPIIFLSSRRAALKEEAKAPPDPLDVLMAMVDCYHNAMRQQVLKIMDGHKS
ncbi:MAG: hypothetical protein LBS89_01725 [Zoogloeaceae bacterium]|jgi:hypothetical protein|nr:hypothetical protein [Zoogloeaceae bacterium]